MAMKKYANITSQDKIRHMQYMALMKTIPKYFGDKVLSQKDIGKLINLTPQTWNNRLRGQRLTMTIAELQELARKLGLSREDVAYIVMGTPGNTISVEEIKEIHRKLGLSQEDVMRYFMGEKEK